MIRPSPNEFERLKNEEFIKRRLLRLKEVREYSKVNASRLRHLYKEQKTKVINRIAENIQEQINSEDSKKISDLKSKYEKQQNALGDAHNNAADWIDPIVEIRQKSDTNKVVAQERHEVAICQLRIEKEEKELTKNARLDALNLALAIERERAIAIASLPAPIDPFYNQELLKTMDDITPRVRVCDRNKFSVIESYENRSYNVQRINDDCQMFQYDADNAMDAGEIRQEHLSKMDTNIQIESEEQSIKAQLRGHHAIKKQIVQKDYGELLTNLEHISKGEMAKRQRDYHKNEFVGPNSAGHLGLGHMAAMMGYKERCRERAVESAVMESLKDITNKPSQAPPPQPSSSSLSLQPHNLVTENNTHGATKLTKLYDIIRKQKENVTFESTESRFAIETDRNNDRGSSPNNEDFVTTNHGNGVDSFDDALHNAVAASIKSDSLLEKLNCDRERNEIEKKIQHIDRRLERIKESDTNYGDISPKDSARSIQSDQHRYDLRSMSHQSQEFSVALSSESACSDSLNIIREFQRQALMKLSGHPSTQHSLNQCSHLSLESVSSITERSWLNGQTGGSTTPLEPSSDSANSSTVSEWVKSQLKQTMDKIPDWVTKTGMDQQFLPDLNMSFMSSILNIRSETGSTRDEMHSSCSTVLTHSSAVRHRRQSSITEISNMDSAVDTRILHVPDKEIDSSFSYQPSESIANISTPLNRSYSSVTRNDSTNRNDIFIEDMNGAEAGQCLEEDLINFISVEDLTAVGDVLSEEEISYQRALNELINMDGQSNYCPLTNIHSLESSILDSKSPITIIESELPMSNQFDEPNSYLTSSKSNINPPNLVRSDSSSTKVDNKLISDYESFLSGLVNKPMISPTMVWTDNNTTLISAEDRDHIPSNTISSPVDRGSLENSEGISRPSSRTVQGTSLETDHSNLINHQQELAYLTSATRDGLNNHLLTLSLSSIHSLPVTSERSSSQPSHMLFNDSDFHVSDINGSHSSLDQLSPYTSETSDTIITNNVVHTLSAVDSIDEGTDYEEYDEPESIEKRKVKILLSSTMKPNRRNIRTVSPDVSSISNISVDACNRLKQKIMEEYFEKNKNLFESIICGTKSSDLSMKPLDSCDDDSTPRNVDSGKPSSRLTIDNSEQNTARLTNDDIFMTPRSDNNWTEYTPRDEWPSPNTNLHTLSDYVSSVTGATNNTGECADDRATMAGVDLDETMKNNDDNDEQRRIFDSSSSLNLIHFDSMADLNKNKVTENQGIGFNPSSNRPKSECLSDYSDRQLYQEEDSVPSKESSSDCNQSPFQILESYNSSCESPCQPLKDRAILTLETHFPFMTNDHSTESRSEADMSSLSLASFLKNESICQELVLGTQQPLQESTPKRVLGATKSIDSSEEMKNKLAQWKKERLSRINQHPRIVDTDTTKTSSVTKTGIIRKQDEVEKRTRTLRLYNNLEEVQKLKQQKDADQRKTANQLKKKEYAERLRRLKKEKGSGSTHH